jgi:Flp pilus assembly protein TadD
VLDHAWRSDFSAARNVGVEAATGDWIFAIDADEYVAPEDRHLVRPAVTQTDADGLWVTLRSLQRPGELLQFVESRIVRLFRRHHDLRYAGIIHEEVTTAIARRNGRIAGSRIVVLHDGYTNDTAQGSENRAARNLPLLLCAAAVAPNEPYWQFHLGATYHQLGRHPEARRHLQQTLQLPHRGLNTEVLAASAIRLAQLALSDQRHGSVGRYAEMALAHEPDNVLAHYLAGLALVRQGRPAEALAHLSVVRSSGQAGLSTQADLDALLDYCSASRDA